MERTVIVSATRTPLGSFQGALSGMKSTELGSIVIKDALKKTGLDGSKVDQVIMGCVLPAGLGQSPARQASLGAGLPKEVGVLTVNKVCSSGLQSVMLADQMIRAGDVEIVIAGGMESMSNAPYYLPKARNGYRMGDGKVVDGMVFDGLWDIYSNQHMGACAELCAEKYGFMREIQDEYAIATYKRAQAANENGAFKNEITTVEIPQRKGAPIIFDKDEEPGRVKFDKIPTLKAPFKKDGTITAANASSISDGAAALVVMSESRAKKEGLTPLAYVRSHAGFSQEPEWFTTAPIGASKRALEKAGLKAGDINLFEINEAFSAVTLAAIKELELNPDKVNVNGGAVAVGHPIGASGARILVTLVHAMKNRGEKLGLATLCNGGGEATAMVIELL
ncbi:MAG: acetyl-CoA C-acetyltransferase [Deltaproteobacteria bacterium]|jgi:acetyl-CoA C-acetyltransferase|nr:acetyl-CoA C-acetyltransferase [Deltaproteobacteria bacterium]